MIDFLCKTKPITFGAAFFIAAITASLQSAKAQTIEAYKAGATSAAGLFIEPPDSLGKRQVSLSISATDGIDCAQTFSNEGMWDRICNKITKEGKSPQSFIGTLHPVKGDSVLEGIVARPNGDFEFIINVLMRGDGSVLAVNAMRRDLSELSSVFFNSSRSDVETATANAQSIIADFIAPSVEASIELGDVDLEGKRSAKLDIRYKGGSCVPPLPNTDGWARICEIADKDGPYSIAGTLEPLANDRSTFTGILKPGDDRRSFQVTVSNARDGYALVGLREKGEPPFTSASAPENVIFGGEVTTGFSDNIDLSANDWRVETESIAKLGANVELNFQKLSDDAYTGNISFWFPERPNAYCPSTNALLQMCESADKDGPLPMIFGVDRITDNVKFGFIGTAQVPPGYGPKWWPFDFDIRQGSSIGDWGDEEPDALYIRFRDPSTPPGTEPIGWLKIVPLNRPMQQIDGDRKLVSGTQANNQPAPPTPNVSTNLTKAGYLMDEATAKACGPDLKRAVDAALAVDGSPAWQTKADWDQMIKRTYTNILQEIDDYDGTEGYVLRLYCVNQAGIIDAWTNKTSYTEIDQRKPKPEQPKQKANPAQCDQLANALARLRSANGVRSDGSVVEDWQRQVNFVEQFLRALPPDPNGTGKSCEKGLEVIASILDKLGLQGTGNSTTVPINNPTEQDKPNGATYCEALASTYSGIGSIDEQNRAREVLLRDGRFKTWKLPSSELSCQLAGELFSQNGIQGF